MTSRRPSISSRHRPPPLAERQIHLAVASLLARPGLVNPNNWEWTHLPMGEKREKQTAALLQAMGVRPGWPDFIFIHRTGTIYFLELKRHDGELSDPQLAFFSRMRARGIECKVARSIEEAVAILARWGVVPVAVTPEMLSEPIAAPCDQLPPPFEGLFGGGDP